MNVLALLSQHDPILHERSGIERTSIFGSFVRGEERPDRDVDVFVVFRKEEETFKHHKD